MMMDREKAKKIIVRVAGIESYKHLETAIDNVLKGILTIHATDHKPLLLMRRKIHRYFPKLRIISQEEEKMLLTANKKAKKSFIKKIK